VADDDEPLTRDARDEVIDIGEVVEEVVVAAGADPVAIAVAAQIGRDDVDALRKVRGDLMPPVAEIEKPVEQEERRVARAVPFEDVVREPCRQGDPALSQGPASI
jgi:hypothetical protein